MFTKIPNYKKWNSASSSNNILNKIFIKIRSFKDALKELVILQCRRNLRSTNIVRDFFDWQSSHNDLPEIRCLFMKFMSLSQIDWNLI